MIKDSIGEESKLRLEEFLILIKNQPNALKEFKAENFAMLELLGFSKKYISFQNAKEENLA